MATKAAPILERIVEARRREFARFKVDGRAAALPALLEAAPPTRDFRDALAGRAVALIAECKQRSPSGGLLQDPYDPIGLARRYTENGAAALSILLGGAAVAATSSGSADAPSGHPTTLPAAATTHANEHAHLPATVPPTSAPEPQTAPTTTSPSTSGGVSSGAGENHGACVSAVARVAPAQAGDSGGKPADPSAHGRAVSAAAHTCPKPQSADHSPESHGAGPRLVRAQRDRARRASRAGRRQARAREVADVQGLPRAGGRRRVVSGTEATAGSPRRLSASSCRSYSFPSCRVAPSLPSDALSFSRPRACMRGRA